MTAVATCRIFCRQTALRLASRPALIAGKSSAANMPMIKTTIIISIKVNPRRPLPFIRRPPG
jgi:hypothetical protein